MGNTNRKWCCLWIYIRLLQKYLSEQKFTKKQFIEGLEYFAERVKDIHYHPQIIITSFYELLYDENKDVWIYRASRITEKFYKNSY